MEEVQREAKACKSCTPFTKLDIPKIWKKEKYVTANNTTKQSKQNLLNKACTKENYIVEYYVTLYKGIEQR